MDESRLGRESIETAQVLKQPSLAGVLIFAYIDDLKVAHERREVLSKDLPLNSY